MKKIISFFAFVSVMFFFAACGGNEPEVKDFTIKVYAMSNKAYLSFTPRDNDAYYFCGYNRVDEVEEKGGLQTYLTNYLAGMNFQDLLDQDDIKQGFHEKKDISALSPSTDYIVYACLVEPIGLGKTQIIGEIVSKKFTTTPKNVLGGVFSVGKSKKVHFYDSNYYMGGAANPPQWWYVGKNNDSPRDLFDWSATQGGIFSLSYYDVLKADEWYYLFRERPRAEELFAHAAITHSSDPDTYGLIILPDDWTGDGFALTPSVKMGMNWYEDENSRIYKLEYKPKIAYTENRISEDTWKEYELAGAVFLPAARSYVNEGSYGEYWSSTEFAENTAHRFYFNQWSLSLTDLKLMSYNKNAHFSIRPAYVIQ